MPPQHMRTKRARAMPFGKPSKNRGQKECGRYHNYWHLENGCHWVRVRTRRIDNVSLDELRSAPAAGDVLRYGPCADPDYSTLDELLLLAAQLLPEQRQADIRSRYHEAIAEPLPEHPAPIVKNPSKRKKQRKYVSVPPAPPIVTTTPPSTPPPKITPPPSTQQWYNEWSAWPLYLYTSDNNDKW